MDALDRTLAERMRHALPGLSPAERRIARSCLSLGAPAEVATVACVAGRAGVSSPTVLRCLAKLGFEQFGDFRRAALIELDARHESALAQAERRPHLPDRPAEAMQAGLEAILRGTFERIDPSELGAAVDLLTDPARRQLLLGGRFSQSLAEQLQAHLSLLRPGTEILGHSSQGRMQRIADLGRSHVLTVFDFRRYQRDTVDLVLAARRRRARIVLVTDPWMSPIADWADVVLVAEVQSASPFDSLVPAMAMVELLVDAARVRLGAGAVDRLSRIEADSPDFEWTGPTAPKRTAAPLAALDGARPQ